MDFRVAEVSSEAVVDELALLPVHLVFGVLDGVSLDCHDEGQFKAVFQNGGSSPG